MQGELGHVSTPAYRGAEPRQGNVTRDGPSILNVSINVKAAASSIC
jgi:hypothetical protein